MTAGDLNLREFEIANSATDLPFGIRSDSSLQLPIDDAGFIFGDSTSMLRLPGNPKRLCNATTRRDVLQIGGLGAFGLALYNLPSSTQTKAAMTDVGPKFGQAKSCILIYKYGSFAESVGAIDYEKWRSGV